MRRKTLIVPVALLLFPASLLADDSVQDAALDRFVACLADEGATVDDAERSALREALGPVADTFGGIDCGAEPARCVEALQAASCDELAAAWAPTLLPTADAPPAPEWATRYVSALLDRVTACYELETGAPAADEELAALEGWRGQLAGMLGQATEGDRCTVAEDALDACLAEVATMPCTGLGGALASGDMVVSEGEETACSRLLVCEDEVDAFIEDVMRQEHEIVE